jgi:hypothetical protein
MATRIKAALMRQSFDQASIKLLGYNVLKFILNLNVLDQEDLSLLTLVNLVINGMSGSFSRI